MRAVYWIVALLLAFSLLTPSVRGQHARQRPAQPKLRTLQTNATVKGWRPRLLHIVTEAGDNWVVSVPDGPGRVVYQATATPQWLKLGMWVRFRATLSPDRRRKEYVATEPVSALTVVTLGAGIEPGLVAEPESDDRDELFQDSPKKKEEEKEAGKTVDTQAKGNQQAAAKLAGESGKRDTEKRDSGDQGATRGTKRAGELPNEASFLVIGRLMEIRNHRIRVAAGRFPVSAEIAPAATVSVSVNNYRLARAGDKVEVSARYVAGRPGQAEGQRLTITAAQPLEVEKQRGRRRSRRTRKPAESQPQTDR